MREEGITRWEGIMREESHGNDQGKLNRFVLHWSLALLLLLFVVLLGFLCVCVWLLLFFCFVFCLFVCFVVGRLMSIKTTLFCIRPWLFFFFFFFFCRRMIKVN